MQKFYSHYCTSCAVYKSLKDCHAPESQLERLEREHVRRRAVQREEEEEEEEEEGEE